MKDKKATIGATMTWILATIIVLIVIILFVFVSFSLGKDKAIKESTLKIEFAEEGILSSISSEQMLLALLDTKIDGKSVRENIEAGDYKKLEDNLKSFLNKLPIQNPKKGNWVFLINEEKKEKLKIGHDWNLFNSDYSNIFINNKEIKLFFSGEYIPI